MIPSGSRWNGVEVEICVLLKQTCFMVLGGFHGEEMQIGEEKGSSMECQPSFVAHSVMLPFVFAVPGKFGLVRRNLRNVWCAKKEATQNCL